MVHTPQNTAALEHTGTDPRTNQQQPHPEATAHAWTRPEFESIATAMEVTAYCGRD